MTEEAIAEPMRLTPLTEEGNRAGAAFIEVAGWRVAERFADADIELSAARERVVIGDGAVQGRIMIEGEHAEKALEAWPGVAGLPIGAGQTAQALDVFRLRQDRFFVHTAPGSIAGVQAALNEAAGSTGELITVTDITDGRAEIRVIGPQSPRLLSRLCGLDFRDPAFPDFSAKTSRLAKTTQLIVRKDLPGIHSFHLIGGQSLGAYVWRTILGAGADLGIQPVGQQTLDALAH